MTAAGVTHALCFLSPLFTLGSLCGPGLSYHHDCPLPRPLVTAESQNPKHVLVHPSHPGSTAASKCAAPFLSPQGPHHSHVPPPGVLLCLALLCSLKVAVLRWWPSFSIHPRTLPNLASSIPQCLTNIIQLSPPQLHTHPPAPLMGPGTGAPSTVTGAHCWSAWAACAWRDGAARPWVQGVPNEEMLCISDKGQT